MKSKEAMTHELVAHCPAFLESFCFVLFYSLFLSWPNPFFDVPTSCSKKLNLRIQYELSSMCLFFEL